MDVPLTLDQTADLTSGAEAAEAPAWRSLIEVIPDFENIDGWLGINAAELLFAAAASVRVGCIVEVGSYRGRSTVALCAGTSVSAKVPVYAIEPHEHFVGTKGGVFGPNDRRSFFRTMLTTRLTAHVRLINTTSEVVAPGWDKPVSLLFIDGDHRYHSVLSDFLMWKPHLVDGALVIFQDATGPGPGLVIKDNVAAGILTPLQTIGRLAMLRFNALDRSLGVLFTSISDGMSLYPGVPANETEPHQPAPSAERHAYYSARGGYLFQAIPGCASLSVKNLLLELEGVPAAEIPSLSERKRNSILPNFHRLSSEAQAELLSGQVKSYKFVFVRDPYVRIATIYRNKIAKGYKNGHYFWIDLVKSAAAEQGIALSEKITFEEFVRVVSGQPTEDMDPHWRPQYYEGAFAHIKFDFVGRMEMISNDLTLILEHLQAPTEMIHRAIQPNQAQFAGLSLWSDVASATRAAFLKTFAIDFEMLRYPKRPSSVLFSHESVEFPELDFPPLPTMTQQSKPTNNQEEALSIALAAEVDLKQEQESSFE